MEDRQHLISLSITSLLGYFVFIDTTIENPTLQQYIEGHGIKKPKCISGKNEMFMLNANRKVSNVSGCKVNFET